jgi:predicted acylesterase/phospholipase RssA
MSDTNKQPDTLSDGHPNTNPQPNIKFQNLVLSGGGLLGISYIGLFKYLEEHNLTKDVKIVTGCSAGSIFGTLFALGYTSPEMMTVIKAMNFTDYLKITADSIINFFKTKGLESGQNFILFLKKCIKDKTGNENITFGQILETYKITLLIGVANITTSKFELFGPHTTPDIPIYLAIRTSCSIPFIFEPVIINGNVYCDGGLIDNLPVTHLLNLINQNQLLDTTITDKTITDKTITDKTITDKTIPDKTITDKTITDKTTETLQHNQTQDTLAIYLMNKFNPILEDNYKTMSLMHYFNGIFHTFTTGFINKHLENLKINEKNNRIKIITFEIPCDIMTFIKLNASHDDIDNIINIAYNYTKENLVI